jgi:hypothetical protein
MPAKLGERPRVTLGEQSPEPDHATEGEELLGAARGGRVRIQQRPAAQLERRAHVRGRLRQLDVSPRPRQTRVLEQIGLSIVQVAELPRVLVDPRHLS